MNPVFKDLKVIELAGVLAGPAVGTFFAEMGAEVLKIESPQGDVTRTWKTAAEDKNTTVTAYFSSVNYGKRFLTLDLQNEDHRNNLYDLVKTADVVIANYKNGDDRKLGTDFETLKQLKPDLIYASVNGYGEHSLRTAYDAVLQAESGFMSMNGTPESGSLKMPVALIDVLAAHQLKEGILTALIHRMKTGKGARVSVSLQDAALASLMNQASNYLMTGVVPKHEGSLHPNIAPYGETFVCSDKKELLLAVGNDLQFSQLCKAIGLETLPEDDQFNTNPNRIKNRTALAQFLALRFGTDTSINWSKKLNDFKVPHGIVKDLREVFEAEEAKRLIATEMINGVETKRVKNTIFKIYFE